MNWPGGLVSTLLSFFLGILVGALLLAVLARLPLAPESRVLALVGIEKPRVIGFQPFWLLDRAEVGYPEITTFAYFALTLDSDGTIVKLVNPREEEPGWTTLRGQKFAEYLRAAKRRGQVPSLTLHASREATVAALLADPETHAENLLRDVEEIFAEYGFRDLNLDIESFRDAEEADREQFARFLRAVAGGVAQRGLGTLTVELTPVSVIKSRIANPLVLGEIADFVVLMGYDFHYVNSWLAGPVAPIGGAGEVREYDVATALTELVRVVPAEKIILGIPLYGYEWETLSAEPGAAVIPGSGATASHRRVQELLASCDECQRGFDEESQQPFVVFPDAGYYHQIFYEDARSLEAKLSLARDLGLRGAGFWALGYEGEGLLRPVAAYRRSFRWVQ